MISQGFRSVFNKSAFVLLLIVTIPSDGAIAPRQSPEQRPSVPGCADIGEPRSCFSLARSHGSVCNRCPALSFCRPLARRVIQRVALSDQQASAFGTHDIWKAPPLGVSRYLAREGEPKWH